MSKKRYVVKLSAGERQQVEELIRKGKSPAKKQLKARILLRADESPLGPKWSDTKISEASGIYPMMWARVRRQFAQGGIDAVFERKQRPSAPAPPVFDGEKEASSSPWPARGLPKAARDGRCGCWNAKPSN